MSDTIIARRRALKYLGMLAGTAAGREFLAGWLPSVSARTIPGGLAALHQHAPPPAPEAAAEYAPKFFKPGEFATVEILTEMIIPTDDKPGAREAQVARYIDFVVFSAAEHEPSLQEDWAGGLALLDRLSWEKFSRAFVQLSGAEREQLLLEISLPEREPAKTHPGFLFYRRLKEMTVEGFYTSRVGLVDVLEYQGLAFLSEFPGCTHPEHH